MLQQLQKVMDGKVQWEDGGVKKKQHKSRKTVREVGSLGPISPQSVMYTVPRSGQTGFHQRVEYDKRIMVMGNTDNDKLKLIQMEDTNTLV